MFGIKGKVNGSRNNNRHQQAIIDLRSVAKNYQTNGTASPALRGVDLTVHTGEFVAVTGKSGAGKSTLVNMITGIDRPTDGEVWVADTPVHRLSEDQAARWRGQTLGIVFQDFRLFPTISVLQNVMLPMALAGKYTPAQRQERALHLLDQVGIANQAHKRPNMLSGGQQQRAAIARALANEPALLIADEPTGNLDSRTADQVFGVFKALAAAGTTILIVTHDRDVAHRVNRIIALTDGRIDSDTLTYPAALEAAAD